MLNINKRRKKKVKSLPNINTDFNNNKDENDKKRIKKKKSIKGNSTSNFINRKKNNKNNVPVILFIINGHSGLSSVCSRVITVCHPRRHNLPSN